MMSTPEGQDGIVMEKHALLLPVHQLCDRPEVVAHVQSVDEAD